MKNTKILITSSHRPTRNTRRFIKALSKVVPNAVKVNRGKQTFKLLALQAIDINADKILVVRNRKGNPGFIDVYKVAVASMELVKICTLRICGYSIDEAYKGIHQVETSIIKRGSALLESEFPSDTLECILKAFNISAFQSEQRVQRNSICVDIEHFKTRGRMGVEVTFNSCNSGTRYLVIRICSRSNDSS